MSWLMYEQMISFDLKESVIEYAVILHSWGNKIQMTEIGSLKQ